MDFDPPPFDAVWFRIIVGFIIGICIGSFTTMLSYRLPLRMSIIHPSSHCPNCHTSLGPRDLIPIFSWISEGGKCHYCKKTISPRYVLIELVTASATVSAFIWLGFRPLTLLAMLTIILCITALTIFIEHHKKP